MKSLVVAICLLMSATLPAAHAQSTFLLDSHLGTNQAGALLKVDGSGNRTIVSDFGNAAQGPVSGGNLFAVGSVPDGLLGLTGYTVVAVDMSSRALYGVNPTTGARTLITDFNNPGQGPLGLQPVAVVGSNGLLGLGTALYVADKSAGTNNNGAIFKVNPATGQRTVLSDFGNQAQGTAGANPTSITLHASLLGVPDKIIVLANTSSGARTSAIISVDANGNRTLLSDLGNTSQGTVANSPVQVSLYSGLLGSPGPLYLTDARGGTNSKGSVLSVSPQNGNRTVTTDYGNAAQGPTSAGPTAIWANAQNALVVNLEPPPNNPFGPRVAKLFTVTPSSGQRSLTSDCGNPSQGPCASPVGVTQVP
ncbi:hypothetical protein [Paraburkholderia rhizosphaerae]|uniref:DNA-binding beta-propeller fold protein YncE n=1 Tax=Paraburkholderia rhizosphaerae TaxID=480658 RepID=A0A4R8LJ21_9BURK|nr:hypothetical protein [Paraburkholderia rhizosphaerae]TDY42250.1 hypothetical protein BX592_12259 [Paraburkholderia rhizosphaerae]